MNQRTPSGGDRSEATYFGPDGNVLPNADGAVNVVVREYVGDVMIARTYMSLEAPTPTWTPPGDAVGEPEAADTTKLGTWDVWDNVDGLLYLATTTASLLHAVGMTAAPVEEQRQFLATLITLPAWTAAPTELKQDVADWLARH